MVICIRKFSSMSLVIIILLLACLSGCDEPSNNNGTGNDFEFTKLDGSKGHLSDYRGKIVILDLWATWCGPCQTQMTELKKIYENYSRNDLEILSIDIETSETSQQVQDFIEWFKNQYDIELDWIFGMDDGSIWQEYIINGYIPTLYIFDQDGKIKFRDEGVAVYLEIPQGWPTDTTILGPKIDALLS